MKTIQTIQQAASKTRFTHLMEKTDPTLKIGNLAVLKETCPKTNETITTIDTMNFDDNSVSGFEVAVYDNDKPNKDGSISQNIVFQPTQGGVTISKDLQILATFGGLNDKGLLSPTTFLSKEISKDNKGRKKKNAKISILGNHVMDMFKRTKKSLACGNIQQSYGKTKKFQQYTEGEKTSGFNKHAVITRFMNSKGMFVNLTIAEQTYTVKLEADTTGSKAVYRGTIKTGQKVAPVFEKVAPVEKPKSIEPIINKDDLTIIEDNLFYRLLAEIEKLKQEHHQDKLDLWEVISKQNEEIEELKQGTPEAKAAKVAEAEAKAKAKAKQDKIKAVLKAASKEKEDKPVEIQEKNQQKPINQSVNTTTSINTQDQDTVAQECSIEPTLTINLGTFDTRASTYAKRVKKAIKVDKKAIKCNVETTMDQIFFEADKLAAIEFARKISKERNIKNIHLEAMDKAAAKESKNKCVLRYEELSHHHRQMIDIRGFCTISGIRYDSSELINAPEQIVKNNFVSNQQAANNSKIDMSLTATY